MFNDIKIAKKNTFYFSNKFVPQNNVNILIDKGILIKNNIELNSTKTTAEANDSIRIKLLSSNESNETITVNIKINDINYTFSVTTTDDKFPIFENSSCREEGTHYYYFTMPESGDVSFSISSNGDNGCCAGMIEIYDTQMNLLDSFSSSQTKDIKAGSYIVKFFVKFSEYPVGISSHTYSYYYNLPRLENGNIDSSSYFLIMPESKNIDFSIMESCCSYGVDIYIYDFDTMNLLDSFSSSQTKYIEAGSYIVNISKDKYDDIVTIYSATNNLNDWPRLKNGSYSFDSYKNEGFHYYSLIMPEDGTIDFLLQSGCCAEIKIYIYDTKMNLLDSFSSSQTKDIKAGSYIIKISIEGDENSISVYSTILDD